MHGVLDVYCEITSLGGHIVNTFEKSLVLDVPEHEFQIYGAHRSVYQQTVPLKPGRYKLSLVLKDDLNGHMGSEELGIIVPDYRAKADQQFPDPGGPDRADPHQPGWIRPLRHRRYQGSPQRQQHVYPRSEDWEFICRSTISASMTKRISPRSTCVIEIEKDGKPLLNQPEDPANLKKASQQFTVVKTHGSSVAPTGQIHGSHRRHRQHQETKS